MVWLCFSELFLNWHLHENVNQSKITWNFNVISQIGSDCFFKYNSLEWYIPFIRYYERVCCSFTARIEHKIWTNFLLTNFDFNALNAVWFNVQIWANFSVVLIECFHWKFILLCNNNKIQPQRNGTIQGNLQLQLWIHGFLNTNFDII